MSIASQPANRLLPRRIAVIDADSIIYAAATMAERKVWDGEEEMWLQTKTLEETYAEVVNALDALTGKVQAEDAFVCLTSHTNFRVELLDTYKGNRKASRQPTFRKPLVDLLEERRPFCVLLIKGLEADDVCGITSGTLQAAGKFPIICSEDKDLKTIPGWLYQRGELTETEPWVADYWHAYQTLVGDSTDNYAGCHNVGPKKAAAILEPWSDPRRRTYTALEYLLLWERVFAEFALRGHSEDYCLTQARVARILRSSDWDPIKHEVIQWQPPSRTEPLS